MDRKKGLPSPYRLTIGAVAQAAGISVETLRTWERRYGLANHARRDGGGQRRYAEEEVRRLRLVRQALGAGHRAASVVPLQEPDLKALLAISEEPQVEAEEPTVSAADWIPLVKDWNWQGLSAGLTQAAAGVPATKFLDAYLGPFLTEVGRAWATGDVDVSQEHLSSECVMEFLSRRWASLNALNTGPRAVFSTLPRERHSLGLHMAAWALATAGARLVFIGADTPLADISRAVHASGAEYLVLSASQSSDTVEASAHLSALIKDIPDPVKVVVGGEGFRTVNKPDVHRISSFATLVSWFRTQQGAAESELAG